MSKHTPGPWTLDSVHGTEYGDPEVMQSWIRAKPQDQYLDGLVVASVVSDCIPEALANANLIAAAPDLLDALENLVAYSSLPFESFVRQKAMDDAEAAIARAKGES